MLLWLLSELIAKIADLANPGRTFDVSRFVLPLILASNAVAGVRGAWALRMAPKIAEIFD